MSRRLVNLTLDTLVDLPHPCRECVVWELEPREAADPCAADPALEKEAWVSQTLLEWGGCGKLAYVDDVPAGYVIYAPPSYLPRAGSFPTAPASPDAALLANAHVAPGYAGRGLGRMLVQAAAHDLARRGVRALEAFGHTGRTGAPDQTGAPDRCVAPAELFVAVGFKTVRPHPRYPRLRLELRSARAWRAEVEHALEQLLDAVPVAGAAGSGVPASAGAGRGERRP
ncbi:MAG: GNAT family N-acetyltransferase [Micromonosporaceae bacterium]|nr:GNAT family N-acetyltransferase [Micromonosporaceae bacterium]